MPEIKPIRFTELKNPERIELKKSVRLGRVHPIRFETPIIHRRGPRHDDYSADALEGRAVSKEEVTGTLPERITYKELQTRRIPFDFQSSFFGGRLELGGMVADFVLLDRPLIIRIQGEYWHSPLPTQRRDAVQRGVLESMGFQVEDLWDYEIYNPDVFYDRMERILSFMPQIGGGLVADSPAYDTQNIPHIESLKERVERIEGVLFRGQVGQQVMIAARNIQVSQLSAITADLGTITAGTINGGQFIANGGSFSTPYIKVTDADTTDYLGVYGADNSSGIVATMVVQNDSAEAAGLEFESRYGVGTDPYVRLVAANSPTLAVGGGSITLGSSLTFTDTTATFSTELIVVGRVGINTASPGHYLDVVGDIATSGDVIVDGDVQLTDGADTDYGKLTFSTGSGLQVIAYDGDNTREAARLELLPSAQGAWVAYTYGLGNFISASDQYRAQFGSLYWVKADQQIALGVSSPASTERLFVSGAIKATLTVDAVGGFKDNGTSGVDGSFVDNNGNTVTVSGGIITNLGV